MLMPVRIGEEFGTINVKRDDGSEHVVPLVVTGYHIDGDKLTLDLKIQATLVQEPVAA